jgi:serine/threonine protein kinase
MKQEIGPEVDWWCFGTIIYEMVVGLPPFYDDEQPKEMLFHRIKNEAPKWKFMISPVLKDLLSKLMDKKRVNRLGHQGAQSVRNHPWFSSVNWEAILKKTVKAQFVPLLKG